MQLCKQTTFLVCPLYSEVAANLFQYNPVQYALQSHSTHYFAFCLG